MSSRVPISSMTRFRITSYNVCYTKLLRVIRGEKSEGMLCSQKELALGDGSAGLMELPEDLTAGATLSAALNLSDSVIEIGLTPNRPDCLSIMGVAREVAALQGKKATRPEVRLTGGEKNIHDLTSVTIEAPDHFV